MRKFLLIIFAVVFFGFGMATAIMSNARVAKFAQEIVDIPGPSFVIGRAEFLTGGNWLLAAYKPGKDQYLRIHGMFPTLRDDSLSGRYFKFVDTSTSAQAEFAFMETDPAFDARMRGVLRGSVILNDDKCAVVKNIAAELWGVVCAIEGGSITYLPEVGVHLILYSHDADPRRYLLLRKS
jgi:hypothetical protein